MISWTCPHCGKKFHSSYDCRSDCMIVCIHCDGTFKNPYFRKEGKENAGTDSFHRHCS